MKTLSLSSRAGQLQPSPTLGITARANAMKAAGIDVISLAAGEPDFPTPKSICDAAIEALNSGLTRYTPTPGLPDLRKAVAEKLARENKLQIVPEQVVVSSGAKQSIFNACNVLLDPGDEVLLFAPYWMTYAEQVRLAGGVPVVVKTTAEAEFVPSLEQISAAITPKTKAILVNSPSNPSGCVWPLQTLKDAAELAVRHGLWVISDEIYERLVYDVEHHSIASFGPEIAERTITVVGCSKTFAMTGWRIGFASAPIQVAKAMSNFQDQVTSCATSFAQKGAIQALRMETPDVEQMRSEYQRRRDLIVSLLRSIPGVEVNVPKGAFYVLPDVSAYVGGRFPTDAALAEFLLEDAKVAVIPGSVFEGHGHLRMSYAASNEAIRSGVSRLADAFSKLRA